MDSRLRTLLLLAALAFLCTAKPAPGATPIDLLQATSDLLAAAQSGDFSVADRALRVGAIPEDASVVSLLEGGYGRPDGAGGFEKSGLVAAAVAHVEALDSCSR